MKALGMALMLGWVIASASLLDQEIEPRRANPKTDAGQRYQGGSKPSPILEARKLKERMPLSLQAAVEKLGSGTVLWRRYGLQMKLLKEDLIWLDRGYTERQILVVQVIVLARTLERADRAIESPETDEQKRHRTEMCIYRDSGYPLLRKMLKDLGTVKNSELRFRL